MENRDDYTGEPERFTCKCGEFIGHTFWRDGLMLLQVGGVVVDRMDGVCAKCGAGVHYAVNEQKLNRLIRHAQGAAV